MGLFAQEVSSLGVRVGTSFTDFRNIFLMKTRTPPFLPLHIPTPYASSPFFPFHSTKSGRYSHILCESVCGDGGVEVFVCALTDAFSFVLCHSFVCFLIRVRLHCVRSFFAWFLSLMHMSDVF